MKKLLVVTGIALALAGNAAVAQDQAGGNNADNGTIGGVAVGTIVAGAVGVAVAAAIISNNSGTTLPIIPPPPPPPPPPLSCEGDDPLVDGECVGTTTTVTVTGTGTGTGTTTVTVPVTFTYAPSAL